MAHNIYKRTTIKNNVNAKNINYFQFHYDNVAISSKYNQLPTNNNIKRLIPSSRSSEQDAGTIGTTVTSANNNSGSIKSSGNKKSNNSISNKNPRTVSTITANSVTRPSYRQIRPENSGDLILSFNQGSNIIPPAFPNSSMASTTTASGAVVSSFLIAAGSSGVSSLSLSSASKNFLIQAENRTMASNNDRAGADNGEAGAENLENSYDDPTNQRTQINPVSHATAKVLINVDFFEIICVALVVSLWLYLICRFYHAWRKYACVHAPASSRFKTPSLASITSLATARRLQAAARAKVAFFVRGRHDSKNASTTNNNAETSENLIRQTSISSDKTLTPCEKSPINDETPSITQQLKRVRWHQQQDIARISKASCPSARKTLPSLIDEGEEDGGDTIRKTASDLMLDSEEKPTVVTIKTQYATDTIE